MKQREVLFNLESNELLELDSDGNPIERATEPEAEEEQTESEQRETRDASESAQTDAHVPSETGDSGEMSRLELEESAQTDAQASNAPDTDAGSIFDDIAFIEMARKTTSGLREEQSEASEPNERGGKRNAQQKKKKGNQKNTPQKGKQSGNKHGKQNHSHPINRATQATEDSRATHSLSAQPQRETNGIELDVHAQRLKESISKGAQKSSEVLKGAHAAARPHLEKAGAATVQGARKLIAETKRATNNLKKDFQKGGIVHVLKQHQMTLILGVLMLTIGVGLYWVNLQRLPKLTPTHKTESGVDYKSFDAGAHPMEILSTVRANMVDFLGEPSERGDGKTPETRYDIYSMTWFGKNRRTVLYYDETETYNRIKLEITNESAAEIYAKLVEQLGASLQEQTPEVKEGWAIWIKDGIKYKLQHRGTYAQLDMSVAKYENSQNLAVGKYPMVVQQIENYDLNGDKVIDEKILLLANRSSSTNLHFDKLYLLIWDGAKTHLSEMDAEYDGGSFPQLYFQDIDKDGTQEIIVSAENNIVNHYNAFHYTPDALDRVYSGYEEPISNEK